MSAYLTINGVELYPTGNQLNKVWTDSVPKGAYTLDGAREIAESILESFVEMYPNFWYWSVSIKSGDGHEVEVLWKVHDDEVGREYITTYVDNELIKNKNNAQLIREAYSIGSAKGTIEYHKQYGWFDVSRDYFNRYVWSTIKWARSRFTQEEIDEAERVHELLKNER